MRKTNLVIGLDFGYALANSLSGFFISVYLWRLTGDWTINGLYHISLLTMVVIGFILGGFLIKTRHCLVPFRIGILMTALFFFLLMIFQEKVASYPLYFGMFYGLSVGFYWIGMFNLWYEVITEENRLKYLGRQSGAISLAGILGPVLAGYIIGWFEDLSGYMVLFAISTIIFCLVTILSFKVELNNCRGEQQGASFILKEFGQKIWQKHFSGWFIIGLLEGLILFLPPILLYNLVKTEGVVGLLITFFGVISVVSSYSLSYFGNKDYIKFNIFMASIGIFLSSLLLFYKVNYLTVIIFLAGNAAFSPLIRISYTSYLYYLISHIPDSHSSKTEIFIGRQVFLTLGRVLAIIFFILQIHGMDYQFIAMVLVIGSLIQILVVHLVPRKLLKS